jgi:hypothetical protein
VLRFYRIFCKSAGRAGVPRFSNEGPNDYGTRLQTHFPEQNREIRAFMDLYIRYRYGRGPVGRENLQELAKLLGRITFRVSKGRDS